MTSAATTPPTTVHPYTEFLTERDEILRHKWLLSEQEGKDVGFERALHDWATHHRADWRRDRSTSTLSS